MVLQNWWYTTLLGTGLPIQPPLIGHADADVVVVGAGMSGLSAAMRRKSLWRLPVTQRTGGLADQPDPR